MTDPSTELRTPQEREAAAKITTALAGLSRKDQEWVLRKVVEHRPELGMKKSGSLRVNDTEFIDWQTKDGKIFDRMDSLKAVVEQLPAATKQGFYEEAQRVLGKIVSESKEELSATLSIKDSLERQIAEEEAKASRSDPQPLFPSLHGPTLRQMSAVALMLHAGHQGTQWPHIDACLVDWHRAGFPTFELTGSLAAALMMTDCRGLLGRDFRTPFAAFAVQLPSPSPIVLPAGDARWALIHRVAATLRATLYASGADLTVSEETIPADDAPLDVWIRGSSLEREVRFIVNLCAYVNSLHALPQPEGRRKPGCGGKRKRDDKESPTPLRWVLGREIKLSPGMMQAARAATGPTATAKQRAQYRMHARFMVRGHWRNQAFGKRHAERRLRWIEPFWKGPEMAEGLARLYSVEEAPKP